MKIHRYFFTLLILCLFACGNNQKDDRALRLGWAGSPDALNPGTAVLSQAYILFGLIYDTLYTLELDGSFSPRLISNRTVSEDHKTWTFHLRSGITFHDGHPLTAHDVAFSLTLYHQHPEFPLLYSYTRQFETVHAPNDSTVVLTLTAPIPNIEGQLVFLWILPKHIWQTHAEGEAATKFDNKSLIGSGPYKLVEYQQNAFVHLSANAQHPLSPRTSSDLVFQTFSNQDALVQAIRTGQVDAILEMPYTAYQGLDAQHDIQAASGTPVQPETTDILINQLNPAQLPKGSVGSGHPALRDQRVRKALSMAVDKQQLINVVLLGLGKPGLTLIPEGLGDWYNRDIQDHSFDIDQAKMLLDEAGCRDQNGDGIRETADGKPLTFRLNWPTDSTVAPRMARMLADMWMAIGVGTQLQAMDPDALTAICCPAFDYDIIIWGWTTASDPGFLLDVMTTSGIATGANETGYSNAAYDALYHQQATERDREKRRQIVWQMQRLVHDDVVYIIPFYPSAVQAYRTDRFTGWITNTPRLGLETAQALSALSPVQ